jgi:hypothetical protein
MTKRVKVKRYTIKPNPKRWERICFLTDKINKNEDIIRTLQIENEMYENLIAERRFD